jgi:hypothetical protein
MPNIMLDSPRLKAWTNSSLDEIAIVSTRYAITKFASTCSSKATRYLALAFIDASFSTCEGGILPLFTIRCPK